MGKHNGGNILRIDHPHCSVSSGAIKLEEDINGSKYEDWNAMLPFGHLCTRLLATIIT